MNRKFCNEFFLFIFAENPTDMWIEKDNQLCRSFQFKDFVEAFAFMTKVAFLAEKMAHHPNWSNVYAQVHIALCTHDQGNVITQKDTEMAAEIDKIFQNA